MEEHWKSFMQINNGDRTGFSSQGTKEKRTIRVQK